MCVCVCVCVGGGFNFRQMALNEEDSSSATNIQDFFSQFGKTDTSNTKGAGIIMCHHLIYNFTLTVLTWILYIWPPVYMYGL